jgi:pseudoazurin
MNRIIKLYGFILILLISNSAHAAETHVVKMLNQGTLGTMVFEPAFIKINTGDSINFEMSDAGHNAVTVAAPAGSVPFDTKYKPSTLIQFDTNGLYLYKCAPHAMMAMAGLIQVSDAGNKSEMKSEIEKFESSVMIPAAKTRMSDLFNKNIK